MSRSKTGTATGISMTGGGLGRDLSLPSDPISRMEVFKNARDAGQVRTGEAATAPRSASCMSGP